MQQPDRVSPARSSGQSSPVSTRRSSISTSSASQRRESKMDAKAEPDESHPKFRAIIEACVRGDIAELQAHAVSKGGFLSDRLRQQAWPILLGLSLDGDSQNGVNEKAAGGVGLPKSWRELPPHRDEGQVELDVNRAFVYYPDYDIEQKKTELSNLITEVLRRYPYLCYFQGYHDICQVFLLVLDPAQCFPTVARLSALRIRDFMLPNLAPAVAQLRLLPDLLRAADPQLWRHLSHTEPFFALSGTLTMYAHDVRTLGEIARLFDALLAREPVFSLYVFAAIVQTRRDELFDTPETEPEMLHSILSKLPPNLDIDALLAAADRLFDAHPPEKLHSWRRISSDSVLKTARDLAACAAQSMDYGRACFKRHVRELERTEARKKALKKMRKTALATLATLWANRGPAFVVTVGVGVLAFWLRRVDSPLADLTSLVSRLIGRFY